MKKGIYLSAAVILAAAIASICLVVSSGKSKEETVPETTAAQTQAPEPETVVETVYEYVEKEVTCEEIESGLRDMGVLVTEEYYFTEVINYNSVKKILGFIPSESGYVASYDGVITAGIDFAGITVEKDDEKKTITVTIPKSSIQQIDIDPDSFELYSEKEGFSNPVSVSDFNDSLSELEESASEKAIERGVLDRADENAQSLIRNFVTSLADENTYQIHYVTAQE